MNKYTSLTSKMFVLAVIIAPVLQARDIEAGPIWNNDDAQGKCPAVCDSAKLDWQGQWTTTIPGRMSVCGCVGDEAAPSEVPMVVAPVVQPQIAPIAPVVQPQIAPMAPVVQPEMMAPLVPVVQPEVAPALVPDKNPVVSPIVKPAPDKNIISPDRGCHLTCVHRYGPMYTGKAATRGKRPCRCFPDPIILERTRGR